MEGQLIHGGSSKLEKTVSFHRQENANEQKFESLDDFHGILGIPDSIKNGMLKIPIAALSKELLVEIVKDLVKFCSLDTDSRESSVNSSVINVETPGFKVEGKEEGSSFKATHASVLTTDHMSASDIGDSSKGFKLRHRLKKCSFCNKRHFWRKELCSSFGKRCSHCNILNHMHCEEACY